MARDSKSKLLEVFGTYCQNTFQARDQVKVIFVGSNPSVKNKDPKIPFLDTRSWVTLRGWLTLLNVRCYQFVNVSDVVTPGNRPLRKAEVCYDTLARKVQGNFSIVALGNTASSALDKIGRTHFKLPHPSPKNRLLNDKQAVMQQLYLCRCWLENQKAPEP